ncbi:MAG: histidinol-phosphate transaminase [bacterium]
MKVRPAIADIAPYIPGTTRGSAVKLSSNENPFGPSPRVVEALGSLASRVHVYPDPGANELRSLLATRHSIRPEQIIVGNGSDEIMQIIAGTFLNSGETTLSSEHTFSQYKSVTQLFGGLYRETDMTDGRFDARALADAARNDAPRIIWLCNPNNPTGTILSHEDVRRVLAASSSETVVVLDEAYADYADSPDFPDSRALIDEYPNLVVLRTFSKLFALAALRVGYGFGHEDLIRRLYTIKQPFNVNTAAQTAACAALGDTEHIRSSIQRNAEGRERMYTAFDRLGLAYYRSHGNFVAVHTPAPAVDIASSMMDAGVAVRALTSFGMPDWIRITVGTQDHATLVEQTLAAALGQQARAVP